MGQAPGGGADRPALLAGFLAQLAAALDLLRQEPFDVVLLDLVMPETDGYEVLEYLRNVEQFIDAAAAVESGRFDPGSLDGVARWPDALGHFAQIFQKMAREVAAREAHLKQQLREARYVFLSYTSADRDRVLPIADRLEEAGIRVWIDRPNIAGGTNYGTEIVQGIRGCGALMIACSERAMQSHNVKQEIQLAWKYQRPYLPILLEPVQIPDEVEYWLEGCQWVEVLDHSESAWLPQVRQALDRFGFEPLPAR